MNINYSESMQPKTTGGPSTGHGGPPLERHPWKSLTKVLYIRQRVKGLERYIRLSDGNVTYQYHDRNHSDMVIIPEKNPKRVKTRGYSLGIPTESENLTNTNWCEVKLRKCLPIEKATAIQMLSYEETHGVGAILWNLVKNISHTIYYGLFQSQPRNNYVSLLRKDYHIKDILHFHSNNTLLLVLIGYSAKIRLNVLNRIKDDITGLQMRYAAVADCIVESRFLKNKLLVIQNGCSIRSIERSDDIPDRSISLWIDTSRVYSATQYYITIINAVYGISHVLIRYEEQLYNGNHLLWGKLLLDEEDTQGHLYLNDRTQIVYGTNAANLHEQQLHRYDIALPKNSIENVLISLRCRDKRVEPITKDLVRWVWRCPLSYTAWSCLKTTDNYAQIRLMGVDSVLSKKEIRKQISKTSVKQLYVANIKITYKYKHKPHDNMFICTAVSNILHRNSYLHEVYVDIRQNDSCVVGTIDVPSNEASEWRSTISRLNYCKEPVRITEKHVTKLTVKKYIYDAVKRDISRVLKSNLAVTITVTKTVTEYCVLSICADSLGKYEDILQKVKTLLFGKKYAFANDSRIISERGQQEVSNICDKLNVSVELLADDKHMVLYGNRNIDAMREITRYESSDPPVKWQSISLGSIEASLPMATKLTLIVNHCAKWEKRKKFMNPTLNFDALLANSMAHNIKTNFENHSIHYVGSEKAGSSLQNNIVTIIKKHHKCNNLIQTLSLNEATTSCTSLWECASCFMTLQTTHSSYEPDKQVNVPGLTWGVTPDRVTLSVCGHVPGLTRGVTRDRVTLSVCGHMFCYECITTQLRTASESHTLLLQCAASKCQALIQWHDVRNMFKYNSSVKDQLLQSALHNYLMVNRNVGFFCKQPDCVGILLRADAVDKLARVVHCDQCSTTYCINCKVRNHKGMTCSEYKLSKLHVPTALKRWLKEDITTRKICPSCDSGIEKYDGCNNVYCTHCKHAICWTCMAYFTSIGETYYHISTVHGAIY